MTTKVIKITGRQLVDAYNLAVEIYIGDQPNKPRYYEAQSFWNTQLRRKMYRLEFGINPSLAVFVRPDGINEVDPSKTYSSLEIETKGWGNGYDEKFIVLLGAELDKIQTET